MSENPIQPINPPQADIWQKEYQKNIITNPYIVLDKLGLDPSHYSLFLDDVKRRKMPFALPKTFLDTAITKGDYYDPVLLQFMVPDEVYQANSQVFVDTDPTQDAEFVIPGGIIHKYKEKGVALLYLTEVCAGYCNYCFRRESNHQTLDTESIEYIKSDSSIRQVLLSGGDPLSYKNSRLRQLLMQLSQVGHLETIRINTRYPVFFPKRVDPEFLDMLSQIPKNIQITVHTNHPNEITEEVIRSLKKLKDSVGLLNVQSVLLKGVNDSSEVLEDLYCKLWNTVGITPYNVNILDQVIGAEPYYVEPEKIRSIIDELQYCLPDNLIPKFVQDTGDTRGKTVWESNLI